MKAARYVRMPASMHGWKDGTTEGWPDGRKEGWMETVYTAAVVVYTIVYVCTLNNLTVCVSDILYSIVFSVSLFMPHPASWLHAP